MAELSYEQRKRLRRLAEDARDACNRHHGPFVDALAHPLNVLALLDMAERASQPKFPMQPVVLDHHGIVRFKENRIVSEILEQSSRAGYTLNDVARGYFTAEERMQFAQLIGYSVSGYAGLSYVSKASALDAEKLGYPKGFQHP